MTYDAMGDVVDEVVAALHLLSSRSDNNNANQPQRRRGGVLVVF